MKKRLLNERKRRIFRRLFSAMLVVVLLSTGMFTDVNAGRGDLGNTGVSDNGILPSPEPDYDEPLYFEPAYEANAVPMFSEEVSYSAESNGTDIFDNTTITLDSLTLKAGYQDDSGKSHLVELTQNGNYELPYNADIYMRLDFMLGRHDSIEPGRPYTYKLPEGIRVDVEADHELANSMGTDSIGTVHISRDGTLTFVFYNNITSDSVPFYVQFDGGLSEENRETGKHIDFKFPTASGDFDFSIDTTGKTGVEEKPEPGPVTMEKSGSRVINVNGQNYIEWTVALGANGREYITGTIHDELPDGLIYAKIPGYPKVSGLLWGNGGYVESNTPDRVDYVDIDVVGCVPEWRANVTFCTYYDADAFGTSITENTSKEIKNTAYFEPEDNTEWSEDEGSVTIRPDMLSKSGSKMDANGNISWTVVINKEKLNLKNLTYTDTFATAQTLVGNVNISPGLSGGSTLNQDANGFDIKFSGADDTQTYTVTYTTHATDPTKESINKGTLTGNNNNVTYNVNQEAKVPGLTLIQKSCTDYNSVTNRFTWQIIVNPENVEMNNVVVKDIFNTNPNVDQWAPQAMKFISAAIGGTPITPAGNDGEITFNLGNISERKVITVVTEVADIDKINPDNWSKFQNKAELTSSLNPTTPVTAVADKNVQVKRPELIDKSGQIKDNGTVEWVITVRQPQLTVEGLTLTDIIPAGMEYVPGTFRLQEMYYDDSPVYREPALGKNGTQQTISYTLTNDPNESKFYKEAFQIYYNTKVTDIDEAYEGGKYTNHAEVSIDYAGDITVEDEAESTVEGAVGGVVNKTYDYKWGTRDVVWTVTINEARNDMKDIQNPKIYDDLADYFDYAGGKLYKLDAKGNKTEVLGNQYAVTVVNGKIIVQLPNIGSDCYQFVFTTRFNCFAALELEGKRITNTVTFKGDGQSFEKESANVDSVDFRSSSAGAVTRREIRVKKVDSITKIPLEGARFELRLNGEVIGEATSGEDGYAVFENFNTLSGYELHLYEVQAPDGYTLIEQDTVLSGYDETNLKRDKNGIEYYEIEIPNANKKRQSTGDIHIKKLNEYGDILPGAEFGLYQDAACTNLLDTRITNASGTADFSGYQESTYYLKEITPPPGYKLPNPNNAVTVVIGRDGADKIQVTYNGRNVSVYEIENTPALGSLRIKKVAKGGTTGLSGASFSIYNDINCNDRVVSGTTGADGTVTLSGLELGRIYYYRENAAPSGGYVLDNTIRSVTVGKGTETEDQIKDITVENEQAKGNIVITKTDNSMPAQTLSEVEFTLYAENGTTVVQGPVTTDSQGVAVFNDVLFGKYVIKETAGKTGYAVSADKNVTVDVIGDVEVTMVNKVIKCDVRIIKKDAAGTNVFLSGARFGLYTQSGKQMAVGVTNADGELVFHDIPYAAGGYVLKELESPEGYKDATGTWNISGTDITTAFNGNGVYSIQIENEKENGSIRLTKEGEKDWEKEGAANKGTFEPLEGAVFTLFDENMLPVAKAESKIGADGKAVVDFTELRYGTYYIQETKAPDGFVRDMGIYKVVVSSDTTQTQYVTDTGAKDNLLIQNYRAISPYISLKLKKIDSETKEPVANATFVMYATVNGKTEPIGSAVTEEDGIAYFRRIHVEKDAAATVYTIKETASPAGYYDPEPGNEILLGNRVDVNNYGDPPADGQPNLTDDQILWVGGDGSPTAPDEATIENKPIKGKILITKTAIAEGNPPLAGVQYTLYQEIDGEKKKANITGVTNPVTTNKEGWAVFDDLPCGIYYVKETAVPKGYTLSEEETKFVIVDDSTQTVTYKDTPIEVWVSKQAVDGSAEIQGAVFKIVAKDNPDKIVDSWTSNDRRPHSVLAGALEINKIYILSEMIAPAGYGYMKDTEFKVNSDGSITITSGGGEKNGQTIVMRDKPINLAISKRDQTETGAELANAIMAILNADGKEIHRFTTNGSTPYQVPLGILSAPKTGYNVYTLREISAPDTYALAADMTFSVDPDGVVYKGSGTKRQVLTDATLIMVDAKKEPFYLRKLDASTRLDVPGAEFEIYPYDVNTGEIGDKISLNGYTTSGRPLKVDSLTEGTYLIRELDAPDGYLTARDIVFKLTFYDDGTHDIDILEGRTTNLNADKDTFMIYDTPIELKIRKQDSFGLILNGATLKLSKYNRDRERIGEEIVTFKSDGQKSYTVLPSSLACNEDYILQELDAPDGYKKADDIILHIAENGVITRDDGVKVVNNTIIMEDDEAGLGIGKFSLDDGECLEGCTLKLETVDDPWWETTTWVSDGHVRTWDLLELTPGCTYILTEMEAPVGYAYTDPITFTIDKDNHQVYQIINGERAEEPEPNRTVRISDGKIKLTVSKQDFYDHVEVPGAELSILDKEGTVLASWVSGSEPCEVDTSKLISSRDSYEEYILREVTAPHGYYKTVDIPFAIDRDGKIYLVQENGQYTPVEDNKIVMYDEPMLTIAKLDTSGNPVVGAKLTITAKDDPNFTPISWVTEAERRVFDDGTFTPGVTYILTETEAPNGYGYGQSLEFMVTADNKVFVNGQLVENRRIVMLDYPIKVYVSKLDGGSRQGLAGAKLVIKNEAGEVIHTFTSTGETILIPKEIFKSVQGGLSYYTLSEIEAPSGYQIAPDIAFAIDSSGNLLQRNGEGAYVPCEDSTLVMLDYSGDSAYSTNPNVPKTGDGTPLGMLIALCIAGFVGACAIFGWYFIRRRKRA